MGTPEFSVPSLEKLIEKFNVSAVFTQPDRPKGRGKKLSMSPVKELALKHNIPVYQPLKIKNDREAIETIKSIQPDFIIVVAFGQILTKEVLEIPKYGCINLHASLLPKLRGAAPINWAIINGESKSGNTTMLMDAGIDTGDMLLKQEVDIDDQMTADSLHDILMNSGAELLIDTINKYFNGEIKPVKQNSELSSYAPMIDKTISKIDWNKDCRYICNLVKGLYPKPTAYSIYNENIMKIYEAVTYDNVVNTDIGVIKEVLKEGIYVQAKDGTVLIKKIQFPGGKVLTVEEYLRGNNLDKIKLV